METLKETWLTDGLIDAEYKQYLLLSYLQSVRKRFSKIELYPYLSDLVAHYRNLVRLREDKALIVDSFPRELSLENLKNLELTYRKIIDDDAVMAELEAIMEFAVPQLKASLDEGAGIYEHVAAHCEIEPVGLSSLNNREGYLFITQHPHVDAHVYRYQLTIFENSQEEIRGLHTRFIRTTRRSLAQTFEHTKLELLRTYTDLPNPAVWLVSSKMQVPFQETLMPIARRMLIRKLSNAA
ncbi:MAG: hypothetical protein K1X47_10875 [Cyclobacteriaceae bacterium]|nr:hypothetical protein [Cyclobacteriaceae bacterium]